MLWSDPGTDSSVAEEGVTRQMERRGVATCTDVCERKLKQPRAISTEV